MLKSVRRTVPSLVSLALNEEQAAFVAELVTAFVVPNSLYSEELTAAAKQAAREAVQPVIQEYKAGEIIVLRGQIITPAEFEALQQFGLIEEASPWQDYVGAGALDRDGGGFRQSVFFAAASALPVRARAASFWLR